MNNLQAGALRDRVTFAKFGQADGEGGNFRGGEPVEQCTLWAGILPLNGGEEVMAGRLQSRRTVLFTVRQGENAKAITTDWICWDVRKPSERFNIREVKPKDNGRAYFEILGESGAAG